MTITPKKRSKKQEYDYQRYLSKKTSLKRKHLLNYSPAKRQAKHVAEYNTEKRHDKHITEYSTDERHDKHVIEYNKGKRHNKHVEEYNTEKRHDKHIAEYNSRDRSDRYQQRRQATSDHQWGERCNGNNANNANNGWDNATYDLSVEIEKSIANAIKYDQTTLQVDGKKDTFRMAVCVVCDRFVIGCEKRLRISEQELVHHKPTLGVASYESYYGCQLPPELLKQYEIPDCQPLKGN